MKELRINDSDVKIENAICEFSVEGPRYMPVMTGNLYSNKQLHYRDEVIGQKARAILNKLDEQYYFSRESIESECFEASGPQGIFYVAYIKFRITEKTEDDIEREQIEYFINNLTEMQ